jgi:acetylornithine/succinyldiaminopimelate/putrescine aminotransferase
MGEYFKKRLLVLKDRHAVIKEVRGIGLIIGMELDREGAGIVNACIEKGFLINCTHDKVLRFVPPLIVGKKEIDLLVEALDDVLGNL